MGPAAPARDEREHLARERARAGARAARGRTAPTGAAAARRRPAAQGSATGRARSADASRARAPATPRAGRAGRSRALRRGGARCPGGLSSDRHSTTARLLRDSLRALSETGEMLAARGCRERLERDERSGRAGGERSARASSAPCARACASHLQAPGSLPSSASWQSRPCCSTGISTCSSRRARPSHAGRS